MDPKAMNPKVMDLRRKKEVCSMVWSVWSEFDHSMRSHLTAEFLEQGPTTLTSHLTVVKNQDSETPPTYTMIDGNHCLRAIRNVQDLEGKTSCFTTISCRVYQGLSETGTLRLGYTRNWKASNMYKMADYDIVNNLRRILTQLQKEGIGQTEQQLKHVYDLQHQWVHSSAHCSK